MVYYPPITVSHHGRIIERYLAAKFPISAISEKYRMKSIRKTFTILDHIHSFLGWLRSVHSPISIVKVFIESKLYKGWSFLRSKLMHQSSTFTLSSYSCLKSNKGVKMHFTLAVPLSFASLALAVSNPSGQKVTSSAAFSSGAGNNNNANIFDGTGNGGSDTYSNSSPEF